MIMSDLGESVWLDLTVQLDAPMSGLFVSIMIMRYFRDRKRDSNPREGVIRDRQASSRLWRADSNPREGVIRLDSAAIVFSRMDSNPRKWVKPSTTVDCSENASDSNPRKWVKPVGSLVGDPVRDSNPRKWVKRK